jgi:hypothetical protein
VKRYSPEWKHGGERTRNNKNKTCGVDRLVKKGLGGRQADGRTDRQTSYLLPGVSHASQVALYGFRHS